MPASNIIDLARAAMRRCRAAKLLRRLVLSVTALTTLQNLNHGQAAHWPALLYT